MPDRDPDGTGTLAQLMRANCVEWLRTQPERDRRALTEGAAEHIRSHYPSTLASLVGDAGAWQPDLGDPVARREPRATADLGEGVTLTYWPGPPEGLSVKLPCRCGNGDQYHHVLTRRPTEAPGTDGDLARLLNSLASSPDPHGGQGFGCTSQRRSSGL